MLIKIVYKVLDHSNIQNIIKKRYTVANKHELVIWKSFLKIIMFHAIVILLIQETVM